MENVLNEIKNKNEDEFNRLVSKCIFPFMMKEVYKDFVNDGTYECYWDYRGEIELYLDCNNDMTFFGCYVDEMEKIDPTIISDLEKIKLNCLYDAEDLYSHWHGLLDHMDEYIINECLPTSETEEVEIFNYRHYFK